MTLSKLIDPETLSCSFCQVDGFLDHEELMEHKEEEHAYELHDQNCSEFDVVTVEKGLKKCGNCFVEWSEE